MIGDGRWEPAHTGLRRAVVSNNLVGDGAIDDHHRFYFYGALLGREGSPWFADRMRAALTTMVSEHLPGQAADPAADLAPRIRSCRDE